MALAHLVHKPRLQEPDEVHRHVERNGNERVEQETVVQELREEHLRQSAGIVVPPQVPLVVQVLPTTNKRPRIRS